ncbi:hypothetical protein GCM10027612_42170 [Microbispora bryophytorum subsp. camponoti]
MTAAAVGLAGRLGRYGLGTAPLGGLFAPVSEDEAEQVLAAAWQAGIRYFDTAPHYGSGLAEERLGRFLRALPRDAAAEAVVSTKVGGCWCPVRVRKRGSPGGPVSCGCGTTAARACCARWTTA